jgi:hypothetical protein
MAAAIVVAARRYKALGKLDRRLTLLTAAAAASGIVGAAAGPVPRSALKEWLWVILALGVLPLGIAVRDAVELRLAAHAVAASGLVILALAIAQPYAGGSRVLEPTGWTRRLTAGYSSPHLLAPQAAATTAWALLLVLVALRKWERVYGALIAGGLAAVVLLTTLRTDELAVVALFAGAAAALLLRQQRRPSRAAILLGAGGTVALLGAVIAAVPSVRQRWLEIPSSIATRGVAWAGSGRGELWQYAWHDFIHNSLLEKLVGSGYYSTIYLTRQRIGTGYAAHTDVLELLVSVGIIGLAIFAALTVLVVSYLAALLQTADRGWRFTYAATAFASFSVLALLTGFIRYTAASIPGLLLIGLLVSVAPGTRRRYVDPTLTDDIEAPRNVQPD